MPKKLKSKPTLEGEHIFPATQLTPLAVKWKDLHSAGRHKEAMAVLEEIVVGSTAMFELSLIHISDPRDGATSRMPSSA